ncbi:MAG: efflux RND transporter permease subunit [Spirochaetes bacterium]|nr:efflux RND transporter permease subunit [Spirochaetota bacterium]MBU0955454.1 efflux RND transporter permease subunit [Spirochaetota bacterium]
MILSDFSVKHPAIIGIILIMLAVFGVIAGMSMNSEMIPPISMPGATIVTIYPGAGAREVERDISRILENQLATLAGVSTLSSSSADSYSTVNLEFKDTVNVYELLPQIRELINGVMDQLPENIDGAPVIYVMEASAFLPIFSVRIDSDMDTVALTRYLEDNVSPAIARVPGVAKINLMGGTSEEVLIRLKTEEMEARKISALAVFEALRYNNINVPSGSALYRTREMSFTTQGSFSDLQELENMTIGFSDGSYIFLKDVADISIQKAAPEVLIRSGGKNYIMMDVLKRDEGDTISIVDNTLEILEEIKTDTRGLITYSVVTDQSETTKQSLNTVFQAGLTGLLLTIIVILFFLHDLRATLIISISIPLSILFSIMGLYLTGRSLNLLSLSGMVVAIGMIVDNSIVILENTYKHFKDTGNRYTAALKGAGEMGGAILASTTTSICVFAPLMFLTGIIGVIMNDLSLAIVFALAASALVAVIIVPWLSSLILKKHDMSRKPALLVKLENLIDKSLDIVTKSYQKVLAAALKNKLFTVTLSVTLLLSSVLLLTILKVSFIPPTDTGEFEIHISTPAGYTLEHTKAKVDELDRLIRELVPEIETAVYYVGSGSALAITGSSNQAFGRIRLQPSAQRERHILDIIPLVQDSVSRTIPDCDITVLNGGFDSLLAMGTGGQGYMMEIFGTDLDDVTETAKVVKEILAADPDVFKTEISVRTDQEQLYADLSQAYMGTLGVTPYEAGITSRILFGGMSAGTLREGSEDYPITISSDVAEQTIDEDVLNRISLRTQDGRLVNFSAFSTMEARQTVSRISRRNRNFSVEVRGYLRTEDQSGVSGRMEAAMANLNLPFGVKYSTGGTSALIGDSLSSLGLMLAISIFLIYSVMVIQFERYIQPLIIMAAIPFCLIGVVLGLYLFNSAMSIIAMLALITLGGTVVNNAIVLVDYTNQLRRNLGMSLDTAIMEAAASRFRPILMTALTTILGVLPMALAVGNGSEVYAPLGQAIFGGMITSTIITLVIIPLLYHTIEKRKPLPAQAVNREQQEAINVE